LSYEPMASKLEHHPGLSPDKSRVATGRLVCFGMWCVKMAGVTSAALAI